MVKVEIVEEKEQDSRSPYSSPASSRTSSSVSLSSVGSEPDGEESFYERIVALADIIPPSTRQSISSKFSSTAGALKTTGKVVGNLVWIVTTSALLIGLPLALVLEDEAKIVQQEKEMLAQQQGAQVSPACHAPRLVIRTSYSIPLSAAHPHPDARAPARFRLSVPAAGPAAKPAQVPPLILTRHAFSHALPVRVACTLLLPPVYHIIEPLIATCPQMSACSPPPCSAGLEVAAAAVTLTRSEAAASRCRTSLHRACTLAV